MKILWLVWWIPALVGGRDSEEEKRDETQWSHDETSTRNYAMWRGSQSIAVISLTAGLPYQLPWRRRVLCGTVLHIKGTLTQWRRLIRDADHPVSSLGCVHTEKYDSEVFRGRENFIPILTNHFYWWRLILMFVFSYTKRTLSDGPELTRRWHVCFWMTQLNHATFFFNISVIYWFSVSVKKP